MNFIMEVDPKTWVFWFLWCAQKTQTRTRLTWTSDESALALATDTAGVHPEVIIICCDI